MNLSLVAMEKHQGFQFFTSNWSLGYPIKKKNTNTRRAIFISAECRGLGKSSAIIVTYFPCYLT